jgi:hypothetical protein
VRTFILKWLKIICFQKGNPYFEIRHWVYLKSPIAKWLEERRLAKYVQDFSHPCGGWSLESDTWADVTQERLDAGCYPHFKKSQMPLYKSKR